MSSEELCFTPASELAQQLRKRALSPVELTEAVLARIEASQPTLNAYLAVAAEEARAAARAAEAVLGGDGEAGPLCGIPFSVKDLLNTAGIVTTSGSRLLADNVPAADSLCVQRLKRAGAVLVGKTTTPEFGHKPLTEGPLFGRTVNPWDHGRTCGGSSGGAGAAVAAGLAPLAVGTDGGGSIRIPAACCGIVGLKPTLGTVPHDQAADAFGNLAYIGPMTRTVLDTALMLEAMAGPDPCDPYAAGAPAAGFVAAAQPRGDLKGLRIAWRPRLGNTAVDPEVLALAEAGAGTLAGLGATVEPVDSPFENTEPFWLVITHSIWASRFQEHEAGARAQMDPSLLAQLDLGKAYGAVELQDAQRARSRLFRAVQHWFAEFDLVATPTLARTAVPVDQDPLGQVEIDGRAAGSLRGAWYPYTHPFNLTGHPAITLPCGFAGDGLPAGLQLVAPWHGEARLLRAAALYEAAAPWQQHRPPSPV